MEPEFTYFGTLKAHGKVGSLSIARLLRADPSDQSLGTIPVKRLRSTLKVSSKGAEVSDMRQGVYECTRFESGLFVVQSLVLKMTSSDGWEPNNSFYARGKFQHNNPSAYDHRKPLSPGSTTEDGQSVLYPFASIDIGSINSAPARAVLLDAVVHIELGVEEC